MHSIPSVPGTRDTFLGFVIASFSEPSLSQRERGAVLLLDRTDSDRSDCHLHAPASPLSDSRKTSSATRASDQSRSLGRNSPDTPSHCLLRNSRANVL